MEEGYGGHYDYMVVSQLFLRHFLLYHKALEMGYIV